MRLMSHTLYYITPAYFLIRGHKYCTTLAKAQEILATTLLATGATFLIIAKKVLHSGKPSYDSE